jgi:hypothetical protein
VPLIAVDATDNIDIAWWSGKGVFFTRSTGGGKSFAAPTTVSTGVGSGFLRMAVDPSGSIYLLWQGSDMHFLLSRSPDGSSFSTPSDLTTALNMGTFSGNLPAIAVDTSGSVDLVWPQYDSGSVMFSRSTDGGETFSAPVAIGRFHYTATAQIAFGAQGAINILWPEETTQIGGTCALHFSRSTDGGASFPPALALNTPDGECAARLLVDSAGDIDVMVFDGSGTYYRSTDGGGTFSNSQTTFKPATVWFGGAYNVDSAGKVYAAVNAFPNHDILFSRSADQGATFSTPMLVSASHGTPRAPGPFGGNDQSLAVDSRGNINILWEDDILTWSAGADIFFSRSIDAGASFSPPQNISRNPGAATPSMALDSQGNVNVVWNNGTVFFSRAAVSSANSGFTISAAPASLTVLPGGSATSQMTLVATGGFNQVVNLSCGNLPQGVECTFNPGVITPTNLGTLATVTLTIPPTLPVGSFPFTVNASAPSISQFQSMQVNVGTLTGSVTPNAATIRLGASANFIVTVAGSGNFAGQFNLTCNAPVGVTCTFTPNSGFLPINGRATSILTVQVLSVPAAGGAPKNPGRTPPELPLAQPFLPISVLLVFLGMAVIVFSRVEKRGFPLTRTAANVFLTVGLTVALATVMLSCGGSTKTPAPTFSRSGPTFTPSGTITIGTVSVSTGGTTTTAGNMTITFPLTVTALYGGGIINVGTIFVTVP